MCLRNLASKKDIKKKLFDFRKENNHNVGYKIFDRDHKGHLHFCLQGKYSSLPIGKWIKEEDWRHIDDKNKKTVGFRDDHMYPIGFHPCLNQKEAIESHNLNAGEVIRKIYFRKVVARGWDRKGATVVSKEIYIIPLKDIKEKKKYWKDRKTLKKTIKKMSR